MSPDRSDAHNHDPRTLTPPGRSPSGDGPAENGTMLKVLNARRPTGFGFAWPMMLCMGVALLILFLAVVQLLR